MEETVAYQTRTTSNYESDTLWIPCKKKVIFSRTNASASTSVVLALGYRRIGTNQ